MKNLYTTPIQFFSLIVLIVISSNVGLSQTDEAGNVNFNFAFGAVTGHMKNREFVSITTDTVLRTYDSLKMMVELKTKCYVYIIYQSSDGDLQLLFPYTLKQFTSDYSVGKNYYIPKGKDWYVLDEKTGEEKFYILASVQRLTDLETTLEKYASSKASEKRESGKKVVEAMKETRKKYKSFTTLAERPIRIGGNIRGNIIGQRKKEEEHDFAEILREISAKNFYSKTITIDHQP